MQPFVCNFDDEVHIDLLRVEVVHQLIRCLGRSSCCQQIIVDEHYIVWLYRVDVHFYSIYSVFLGKLFLYNSANTTPHPNRAAKADAITKPRLSTPTILVIPLSL